MAGKPCAKRYVPTLMFEVFKSEICQYYPKQKKIKIMNSSYDASSGSDGQEILRP